MIDIELIHDPGRCIPFDIWTVAYMRALHTQAADEAARTADRAVDQWMQKRLQYARDRVNGPIASNC